MAVANNAIIIGHTTKLNIVHYKSERVLTYKMIDEAHARNNGAAHNIFQKNKTRFIEGKHYHMVKYAEAEALKPYGVDVPPRGLTLITERGYLLLVKSFTDDLAWEVQEQLVDHYFRGENQLLGTPIADKPETITSKQYYELKNMIHTTTARLHFKDKAQHGIANMIRFKLNVGGIQSIRPEDYTKAVAILEMSQQSAAMLWDIYLDMERLFVEKYMCEGIPFTSTLRKEFTERFQRKLPPAPDWREVVRQLEAPDDDGPEPLPQS